MPWPAALERLRHSVGLWTMTLDATSPDVARDVVSELDERGWRALWTPEAWGREAFTSAGLYLSATSSLIVATGIASIWGRDAVATQNASKTLTSAYDDRFVLGLGVSHRPLVERLRGHDYDRPRTAMSNYLNAMDAVPMTASEGSTKVARVLAALGPKMLELSATNAHGAHTYLVTPEHTQSARATIGDAFLAVEQAVVVGQSREEYLRRAHDHLEFYTGLENYQHSWRRMGFGDEDFVRGGSERLCDAMVVHGDESAISERVSEHHDAGADHVCLQVLGETTTSPPLNEWRQLASLLVGP